jgi:soluble lytic murein transglycosylase-like protein
MKPPDILLLVAFLLIIGIGYYLWAENPTEAKIERKYATDYWILGGNSVKAVVPPTELQPTTLTSLVNDIIWCESRWQENAVGKAGEIGVAQFLPQTWNWMSKISGIKGDLYNTNDQIRMLRWALQNGYAHHWTCYKIIK